MTTDTEENTITGEDCLKPVREYWRQVRASEGFDIEHIIQPPFCTGLVDVDCQRGYYRRHLVKGYALAGLQRYNMLQGTSFQLHTMLKYNKLANCVSSYYMTLIAQDSVTHDLKTFQIRVDEQVHAMLAMTVSVARVKDEGLATIKKPFVPHFDGDAASDDDYFQGGLPDWPSDDAFNDTKRFYLVKRSEWQDSDWIYPYLQLVVVRCNPDILLKENQDNILNDLDILKVAIETKEDDKLNPKCAHVYITFKGLKKTRRSAEVGVRVERKVIIRRVLDEVTGYLTLLGEIWLGKDIRQPSMILRKRKDLA